MVLESIARRGYSGRNLLWETYHGSTVDNNCIFGHNFRSQLLVSKHSVRFVSTRNENTFDSQVFESVVDSFGSTAGSQN